jgi:serine-type D-Ala-D-Ala endopeptidase (penicillin-binding protein 7)
VILTQAAGLYYLNGLHALDRRAPRRAHADPFDDALLGQGREQVRQGDHGAKGTNLIEPLQRGVAHRLRDAGIRIRVRKCDTPREAGRGLPEGASHSMNRRHALRMMAASTLVSSSLWQPAEAAARQRRDEPDVRSNTALVLDRTDHSVLFSRRADVVLPIASITKLMTALVVLDGQLPMDEMLEISPADRAVGRGTFSRLAVGTRLSRGDLMCLALMSSENRAAHALGRNYPGGEATFVRTMNMKARTLGMTRTSFAGPSGLSSKNVATAMDLSKLVIAASKSAAIREYSTCKSHAVRVGRQMMEFRNTNSLVSNPEWGITVQKTGYIEEAGRCLVMQATIESRPTIFVLLDSYGKYTRTADAKRIRQWLETRADTRTARSGAAQA